LLAQLAQANNTQEAYAAIDNLADPVGSYRIKREHAFSISLNAYGGLFIGHEDIDGVTTESKITNYGLAGLVGVGFNLGRLRKTDRSPSLSLFLSAIDVSALVSYRVEDNDDTQLAELEWKDVFSPGAHAVFGFVKSPVCLAFGISQRPRICVKCR
jgi:hypothetical protein